MITAVTDERAAGRRAELADNLTAVRGEIAAACAAAGREADEVTLIAVTKTFPASDVRRLAELGVTDVGENRDQEAAAKAAEVADAGVHVRWHFVGRLQRNKCRSVARYAGMVHSVDRAELIAALARSAAVERDTPLPVLLQVSLDGDRSRGGADGTDVERLAELVAGEPSLWLRGVMGVAPLAWPPRRAFDLLAEHSRRVRRVDRRADAISAGMSKDFAEAIAGGTTMIRIGAKLLGLRPFIG